MSDPIRYECPSCGDIYFPTSQDEYCPHENTSSFTKALARQLKELLKRDGDE